MLIVAHRGYSAREPESTLAAYVGAIGWAERTGVALELECDVHFSADDQLICLHDLTVDRTSDGTGPAVEHTVDELRALDFGSWRIRRPTPAQRQLVTLAELLELVAAARRRDVPVGLAIETKHPNPRGLDVEERVRDLLAAAGWDGPDAPVRMITFSVPAVERLGELLPALERTLLVEQDLGPWRDGHLPDGVRAAGVDLALIREDPAYVARARTRGNDVHVWTVNAARDVRFCHALGVTGLTTDDPERVRAVLAGLASHTPVSVSLARVACLIPAVDEVDRIAATVRTAAALPGVDLVIVCDDGSSDGTGHEATAAGAVVVTHSRSRGKAAALESGVNALGVLEQRDRRPECGTLLLLDADLGESATAYAALLRPVRDDRADLAIARPPERSAGLVATAARRGIAELTGWTAEAPLSGLRALTRRTFELASPLAPGWGANVGMTVDALRAGLRVLEVEVATTGRPSEADLTGQLKRTKQLRDVTRALAARGLVQAGWKDFQDSGGVPGLLGRFRR